MSFLQAAILGIVEGLTEFLPISSTFHLIIISRILLIPSSVFIKFFDVVIQAGAIMAVCVVYFDYIKQEKDLLFKILLAYLPTGMVGFLLYKIIKDIFFERFDLMLTVFIAMAGIFFMIEYMIDRQKLQLKRSISSLSWPKLLFVGLNQSLAVIPGVSRAGAVIVALMFLGIKRDEAAKFSFILAMPTILSAAIFDVIKIRSELILTNEQLILSLIGILFSFISAYLVVRWFIGFLQCHTLRFFAWYRVVITVIFLIFWLLGLNINLS